jgi:hypothetical protein
MANQRIDISRARKKIEAKLKKVVSTNNLKTLATEAIRLIQSRTRKGKGVKAMYGKETPLAKLSDGYIEQRRRMKLSPFTKPTKSNLTRTGRMIASLRLTTKNKIVEIAPTGTSKEGISNQAIANFNAAAKKPRVFLNISQQEFKKLILFYKRKISTIR